MIERSTPYPKLQSFRQQSVSSVLGRFWFFLLLIGGAGCGALTLDSRELARAGGGDDGPRVLPVFQDDSAFELLEEPIPGEWRAGPGRSERPQSFPRYVEEDPVRSSSDRHRIVLQLLGDFEKSDRALLESIRAFVSCSFACRVDLAESLPLPQSNRRSRIWNRGGFQKSWVQHHTKTIMHEVLEPNLPEDAICCLGITQEDLYPDPQWEYVFGQAYLHRRVGVYSLARYFGKFWMMSETQSTRRRAHRRAMKVIGHEVGHMFSLAHCAYYRCIMNGSNSLEESDRLPLWFCPVCASKLVWNRGIDPRERYLGLERFFRDQGFEFEADWFARRVSDFKGPN